MHVVTLKGAALVEVLAWLTDLAGHMPHEMRVGIDEEGVKFSVDRSTWSPGRGVREPETASEAFHAYRQATAQPTEPRNPFADFHHSRDEGQPEFNSVAYEGGDTGFIYIRGREIPVKITATQWAGIEAILHTALGSNSASECPYCHGLFYSYHNDDPLKIHMEYCESRPADEDEDL